MKKIAGLILKELLVQIILSTVLVVILAFIVFELSLGDKGRNRRWSNWTWHRSSSSFRLWNFWWNAWVNSMRETDHRI